MSEWSGKALSLSFDEAEILGWIIDLFNGGEAFELDATYSTGRMWRGGLPEPAIKMDLQPQSTNVLEADSRDIPLPDASVSSVMFDPPFVMKNTTTREPNGIIESRFSGYGTPAKLWSMYRDSLHEFSRILRPGGILVFKNQDVVSSGKNQWSHIKIYSMATAAGFTARDLFVLGRKNVLWSPNMRNQKHARKNHCFYWVLEKGRQ